MSYTNNKENQPISRKRYQTPASFIKLSLKRGANKWVMKWTKNIFTKKIMLGKQLRVQSSEIRKEKSRLEIKIDKK